MEEALIAHLLADTGVAAIFGDRVTWVSRNQGGATPAAVLTRISGVRGYTFVGADGLVASRVQVDCFATTFSGAKAAARAIIASVSGAKFTRGGIEFQNIFVDGERDVFLEGARLYETSVDLLLTHTE